LASQFDNSGDKVKLLLRAGANIELGNKKREVPLIVAARANNNNAVKILIKAGAKIEVLSQGGTCTLLMLTYLLDTINASIVSSLLEAGANVAIKNNCKSALFYACRDHSNGKKAKLLLAAGAYIDLTNELR